MIEVDNDCIKSNCRFKMNQQNRKINDWGQGIEKLFFWLLYTHLISKIPYRFGQSLRKIFIRVLIGKAGADLSISTGVRILCPMNIFLGNRVAIARDTTLDGRGKIEIGDEIPEYLYKAIAEILAFVYKLNKQYSHSK